MALVVLGLVALLPDCASACSCMPPPPVERALADSSAVFAGEVIDIEKGPQISSVTFRASKVWKGKQRETRTVSTASYGAACGYPFKEGKEYLVYAYWGRAGSPPRPTLMETACGPTEPLSEADANLRLLGEGPSPGDEEPLPDTSGGVGGLGMVGLAGIAAATAGYLLLRRLLNS